MIKEEAIKKLSTLKTRGEHISKSRRGDPDFKKWHRDTEVAIERIFGEGTRHTKDFTKIRYSLGVVTSNTTDADFDRRFKAGLNEALTVIASFIDEIDEYWNNEPDSHQAPYTDSEKIVLLIKRFHQVARQLRSRHSDRSTLEIEDEYDVQDLFHSLLKLNFDDIRAEEYTPSYAGSASRVDFLLKKEEIIIEIKKTRKGLGSKEIGEQLIIDSQRYQVHPNCNQLICFVYDPEGRIGNPKGIEGDLTKELNGIPVSVYITPQQ